MTVELADATDVLVEKQAEAKRAEYEMSTAKEVQQQLLPAQKPEVAGWELAGYYLGAKAVSGDYYDYIDLGNGRWGFIIADVSGKGIPGSMVMAVTRTIVRLVSMQPGIGPGQTLKQTNRLIAKNIKRGMFVTAFYAILDQTTGELTFSSAGHNPMVVYRAANRTFELHGPKGIAIGFNEGPLFDKKLEEFRTTIAPGDTFSIYTDGFPEAMNEENEEFGDEEFYKAVASFGHLPAEQQVEGCLNAIIKHRGSAPAI